MYVRRNLKFVYNVFSTNFLIKSTSQGLFLPFYHTISDERLPHISNLYTLRSQKLFENDINYLCQHFKPISMSELCDIVYENKPIKKPVFHLTFDDGLSGLHDLVAPILERKGIPATFFINTEFIDNRALFYRFKISLIIEKLRNNDKYVWAIFDLLNLEPKNINFLFNALLKLGYNDVPVIELIAKKIDINFEQYLSEVQPYLTTSQTNDLIRKGFSIGSHSVNHPLFKDISIEIQKKQVNDSFEFLKEKFDLQEMFFSFPFSDDSVQIDFFKWLYEQQGCKLSFGTSGLKHDFSKFHLHRTPFDGTLREAKDIVKSEYFYFLLKYFLKRNTIRRL